MGWWKIDPKTGKSPEKGRGSKLSPPGMELLNAVPGVDDAPGNHYLGDTNWDFAADLAKQLAGPLLAGQAPLTDEGLRDLLLNSFGPGEWPEDVAARVFEAVDLFWRDLDAVYQEDWNRSTTEPEKRWTAENVVESYHLKLHPPAPEAPGASGANQIVFKVLPPIQFTSQFAVGDRVWAWWNSSQEFYYAGTVMKAGGIGRSDDGKEVSVDYQVKFDDGDSGPVPPGSICRLTAPPGLAVNYRPPGDRYYYPAVVVAAGTGTVRVRTQDGRELTVPYAALSVSPRFLKK